MMLEVQWQNLRLQIHVVYYMLDFKIFHTKKIQLYCISSTLKKYICYRAARNLILDYSNWNNWSCVLSSIWR